MTEEEVLYEQILASIEDEKHGRDMPALEALAEINKELGWDLLN